MRVWTPPMRAYMTPVSRTALMGRRVVVNGGAREFAVRRGWYW